LTPDTPKRNRGRKVFAVRKKSGAVFIDMGATLAQPAKPAKETIPDEQRLSVLPWSPWGCDNLLAQQYVCDIDKCGVLSAIIDGRARFAYCQGMLPAIVHIDPQTGERVIDRFVDNEEVLGFLENNNAEDHAFAWMKDLIGFGFGVCRFILDKEGKKIVTFQRDDPSEIRFNKQLPDGSIPFLWYSANWEKIASPNDERVFKVRLLRYNNPLEDLRERVAAGEREFAFVLRNPGWGRHYYPLAPWMPAYKWVKIAQAVPEMKAAIFENSMRPKWKVTVLPEYWDNRYGDDWSEWDEDKQEAAKEDFYDEIDELLHGKENQGKTIFVNGKLIDDTGKVITDIMIEAIKDEQQQGELLPDSAAANSEISIAMLWNPALTGGNQKAGVYAGNEGGSNVRESHLFQTILHERERSVVRRMMNIPKNFNGWNTGDLKGMEFIIPMTVLTTTDTGGSSKPVVTGNVSKKNE
jgi:hypothetical protein